MLESQWVFELDGGWRRPVGACALARFVFLGAADRANRTIMEPILARHLVPGQFNLPWNAAPVPSCAS